MFRALGGEEDNELVEEYGENRYNSRCFRRRRENFGFGLGFGLAAPDAVVVFEVEAGRADVEVDAPLPFPRPPIRHRYIESHTYSGQPGYQVVPPTAPLLTPFVILAFVRGTTFPFVLDFGSVEDTPPILCVLILGRGALGRPLT